MKSVNHACLGVLIGLIASAASADAASARRGDVVYVEDNYSSAPSTTLRVRSPFGVVRSNLRLAADFSQFRQIGMSNDGRLAFLMRSELGPHEEAILVVAMKSGPPKVLSKHAVAPFVINSLAGCNVANPAAIAAGLPIDGKYPVFLGLACVHGCNPKVDEFLFPLFSATWVVHLSYDVRTRKFTRTGATRTSITDVCSRDTGDQVRALHVPQLSGGRNGEPLMVFSERDARTFRFRGVKSGSPNLLSWRSGRECGNFVIGGPSEFYAFCYTDPNGFKQIKRTSTGQRVVTNVGRAPAFLGHGSYVFGMAVLQGAREPFYGVTEQDNGIYYAIRHSKAHLNATGKVAFRMTGSGPAGGEAFLIAVVP